MHLVMGSKGLFLVPAALVVGAFEVGQKIVVVV